jgi:hypothetical protein
MTLRYRAGLFDTPCETGTIAAKSCGKAARWKSQRTTFPPRLEHAARFYHFPTGYYGDDYVRFIYIFPVGEF